MSVLLSLVDGGRKWAGDRAFCSKKKNFYFSLFFNNMDRSKLWLIPFSLLKTWNDDVSSILHLFRSTLRPLISNVFFFFFQTIRSFRLCEIFLKNKFYSDFFFAFFVHFLYTDTAIIVGTEHTYNTGGYFYYINALTSIVNRRYKIITDRLIWLRSLLI